MSAYQIEVEVTERDPVSGRMVKVWKPLTRTCGKVYNYNTRKAADRIRRLCYPEHYGTGTRLVEVV